jgi:protein gp37
MAETTGIEWCDHTFNPWIGCTQISPACDHCYAMALVEGRMGRDFAERRRTSESNWRQPVRWNRRAQADGVRRRVFCASLADVFDNQVPVEWLLDLLDLISITPSLDWLLLTKRPQNIGKRLTAALGAARDDGHDELARWLEGWIEGGQAPGHIWLGTTAENQAMADLRIPWLLAAPAAVRFVSAEPLLGSIDLEHIPLPPWMARCDCDEHAPTLNAFTGDIYCAGCCEGPEATTLGRLGLVIPGGESGSHARPTYPDWVRSLRDQCTTAGVAFFFKQWGAWVPRRAAGIYERVERIELAGGTECMLRLGKKSTGRLLDGVQHDGMPGHG